MSSTKIEREVVQMVFDAKQFEKGIQGSIQDISDLKKSFDFAKAQESLAELGKAAQTDFSPMASSLEAINQKLSIVGVAAATFVSNITNAVINSAKKMADALILDPIKTGLEEYETQLNAVQTILANTSKDGTTLETVSAALDELNSYADLTIYNFTQMTDSIGKFTTAGVDLDTSVSAIKGIANAAALSGSNAQQASTAMYQLSQAISSGTVRLQDWISVENAGMGGEIFKESLMETARVHGVAIDSIVEQEGSFRASLAKGWLSSEIMLETLSKFTGDLTAEQLKSMGYTEAQITEIQKMAEMASDAATKIKTLTQLKDTMAEAMQSGWGQTWRIVFGDFEEAKTLWGNIGTTFGDIIANSSDARNAMLELWKGAGGRDALIKGFMNTIQAVINIVNTFKAAIGDIFAPFDYVDLFQISFGFMRMSEAFLAASENSAVLKSVVRGIAAIIDIIRLTVMAFVKTLYPLVDLIKESDTGFSKWVVTILEAITSWREWAIEADWFDKTAETIVTRLSNMVETIKDVVSAFLDLSVVKDVSKWIGSITIGDFVSLWDGLISVLRAVATPFAAIAILAKILYDEISKLDIIQTIVGYFKSISWEGIKSSFSGMATGAKELNDGLAKSDILAKFLEYISTFDGRRITQFFSDGREHFSWLSSMLGKLTGQMGGLESSTKGVGEGMGGVVESIKGGLTGALDYLINNAQDIDYSTVFDRLFQVLNTGILAAVALGIRKIAGGGWLSEALGSIGFGNPAEIGEVVTGMFDTMSGTLTAFQNNIKADTLQKIAIAIALLAGSIVLLTLVNSDKLLAATAAISAMVVALFGSAGALKAMNTKDAVTASVTIVALAIAMAVLAGAMAGISTVDPSDMAASMAALAGGILALTVGVKQLGGNNTAGLIKASIGIIGITIALKLMVDVIRQIGALDPKQLAQGLLGISAGLAILVTAVTALSKFTSGATAVGAAAIILEISGGLLIMAEAVLTFGNMDMAVLTRGLESVMLILIAFATFSRLMDSKGLFAASLGIGVISASLLVMAAAVKTFGSMNWDELTRGLAGLAGAMLIVVIAANAMSGAALGAVAMLIMSVAIAALAGALTLLGQLSWEQLGVAVAGLAAVFVVLGLAGLLLTPLIPVLLLLGAAMLLIGLAAASFGLGLLAAASGLVAIGASAAVIAAGIGIVGAAVIGVLPALATALGEGLVNFLVVIADNTPKIIEAMSNIMLGMIAGMISIIPDVVVVILDMMQQLLTAILDKLPTLIKTGWEILKAFLQGIVDHIADVVAMGIEIVTQIINGIAEALPDLVDSAFNLLLTFLTAIDAAIVEYMPQIIAMGFKIGGSIITGMVQGLWDGIDAIKQAISDLVEEAIQRFRDKWNIHSPSQVTYDIAGLVVVGFINGIRDKTKNLRDALSDFGQEAQNGISPYLAAIGQGINDSLEFSPLITPVLDLANVEAGVGRINGAFGKTGVFASLTYQERRDAAYSQDNVTGTPSKSDGVTFIQNNYSPTALDRAAIFRQTRTQVAKLAALELA